MKKNKLLKISTETSESHQRFAPRCDSLQVKPEHKGGAAGAARGTDVIENARIEVDRSARWHQAEADGDRNSGKPRSAALGDLDKTKFRALKLYKSNNGLVSVYHVTDFDFNENCWYLNGLKV